MPHYGRHGYDYWHQNDEGRLIVGGFRDADMDSEFTAEEATTERIQGALDGFAEALLGPDAGGDASLGRRLRARPRPDAGRRAASRRATGCGSRAATRDTGTCSA